MAKVAFVIESLPPTSDLISGFAFSLARSLADQQHDVLALSTYRPGHPGPRPAGNLSCATPFSKWNWIEAAKAGRIFAAFQPDILHLVQPHAEALTGVTNAMSALPPIARAIAFAAGSLSGGRAAPRRPAVVASFFDLRGDWRKDARGILAQADAVTGANEAQLRALLEAAPRSRRALGAIAAPGFAELEGARATERIVEDSAVDSFLRGLGGAEAELVLAPGDAHAHSDPARLFRIARRILERRPRAAFAIEGAWGRTPAAARFALMRELGPVANRFAMLAATSRRQRERAYARASLILAPTLGLESLALAEAARLALKQNSIFLALSGQVEAASVSEPFAGWIAIAPDDDDAIVKLAETSLAGAGARRAERERAADGAQRAVADAPGNVVSRLYARLLA